MSRTRGPLSVLKSAAAGGVVLLTGLVVVGGLVVGAWAFAGVAVLVCAAVLYIMGVPLSPGDSRGEPPDAVDRYRALTDDSAFTPRETPVDRGTVYETTVDDRPVTVRLVGSAGDDSAQATTLVETPTGVARPGTGFAVDRVADDAPLPAETARQVRSVLRATGGRLQVDDRVGVVRYECGEVLADPDALRRAAETVTAVAGVTEDRAGDRAPARDRSLEVEDSARG